LLLGFPLLVSYRFALRNKLKNQNEINNWLPEQGVCLFKTQWISDGGVGQIKIIDSSNSWSIFELPRIRGNLILVNEFSPKFRYTHVFFC
jgi:hypothetical protein